MMQDEINEFYSEVGQDIIELHNIARRIENTIGQCAISEELRNIADGLTTLTKQGYYEIS